MSTGIETAAKKHSTTARQTARKEFDRWAGSYDRSWLNEVVFFPSIRACQEEILRWQHARGGGAYRILDVGCGTGNLLSMLVRDDDAEMLVGLDYSPVMVSQFAEKIRVSPAARERVHAVHGDSERLPFADASFDVLTCCNSFHHYPHQPVVVSEFRRVLRPGGMALLIDGFRDNVIGWMVFDVVVTTAEKDVHHAPWTSVRTWFQQAGFRDVKHRKMNVLAPLLVTTGRV